jgi:phosphoribulokinase
MNTQARDPQFASYINEIAESVQWPDATFTIKPWEAIASVVVALYEGFASPDRAILQHALNGIAF